ncbi:restriction endonuclease subunit R [Staphylococcus hominis]|jgi:hypothetical protein|nr:restriction endonuclease subunit R [Staphylococcus hominis]MCI2877073.1 hypothetical protein [Staphylococcus hominis]TRL33641.1 restriction endonuclease subunit R [Staphylococcus hominis]
MTCQNEYALENVVFHQLEDLGYERVNIHNIESKTNDYLKKLGVLKHD